MRRAFSLIELLISVMILSILMLFLYRSYASLNSSNKLLAEEIKSVKNVQLIKKSLFMDFTLAFRKSVVIFNENRDVDIVYLQSANSLHNRINPYIAYIVKEGKLYRLELLKSPKIYPLPSDIEFVSDYLGDVKSFRVYPSKDKSKQSYLLNILFKDKQEVTLVLSIL
jgi:prepilin-type N-terminal cleavage/methylation domain-containing protein